MNFKPLSALEEKIGKAVVDACFKVHRTLGPGLLESVYETCFCYELEKSGLSLQRQVSVPVRYEGFVFDAVLRLDVLIEKCVICELKSVETMVPIYSAQLLSYLRLSENRLGYLINFNVPLMKNGIKRMIN